MGTSKVLTSFLTVGMLCLLECSWEGGNGCRCECVCGGGGGWLRYDKCMNCYEKYLNCFEKCMNMYEKYMNLYE